VRDNGFTITNKTVCLFLLWKKKESLGVNDLTITNKGESMLIGVTASQISAIADWAENLSSEDKESIFICREDASFGEDYDSTMIHATATNNSWKFDKQGSGWDCTS
jgi:hypothetical protein